MDWGDLEKHFSAARLGRYRASCNGDEIRAARAYVSNMLLAEAMMPMLNVLEIALKNGAHQRLTILYKRADWWETWPNDALFSWQVREVANAKAKLQRRAEPLTPDKIIAELPETTAPAPYRFIRAQPDSRVEKPCLSPRAITLVEPAPHRTAR